MPKISKTLGIIPARYASSRFPGKPLADILGKSMIQRVYEQAGKCSRLDSVVVATDDGRIFNHVQSFGGNVVMTSANHLSGTDRCAEVAGMEGFDSFDLVVNIQGDEPFIQPSQIELAVDFLEKNRNVPIATLAKKIEENEQLFSPNVVKVVFDRHRHALYFSRSPIPFFRNAAQNEWLLTGDFYKHIGLYAFRREALIKVAGLSPGRLELAESLEQLRWLENGLAIGVAISEVESAGIDSPEDLARLINTLESKSGI